MCIRKLFLKMKKSLFQEEREYGCPPLVHTYQQIVPALVIYWFSGGFRRFRHESWVLYRQIHGCPQILEGRRQQRIMKKESSRFREWSVCNCNYIDLLAAFLKTHSRTLSKRLMIFHCRILHESFLFMMNKRKENRRLQRWTVKLTEYLDMNNWQIRGRSI